MVELQPAQEGRLAAAGRTQQHHRPLGNLRQHVSQIGVVLRLLLEAQSVFAPHHVQQSHPHEPSVDVIALRKLAQKRLAIGGEGVGALARKVQPGPTGASRLTRTANEGQQLLSDTTHLRDIGNRDPLLQAQPVRHVFRR